MKMYRIIPALLVVIVILGCLSYGVVAQQSLPLAPELHVTEAAQIKIGDQLFSVAWNPVNHDLVVSGIQGVYLYDVQFALIATLKFETNPATISTIWSPDGQTAASMSGSGNIYFWDVNTRSILDVWHAGTITPTSIAWSPDGTKVARTNDIDGTIKIYDVLKRQEFDISQAFGEYEFPKSIDWNADSRRLLFIGQNDTIYGVFVFDTATDKVVNTIAIEAEAAHWSPDGTLIATGGYTGNYDPHVHGEPYLGIIDIWSGEADLPYQKGMLANTDTDALAWRPNGQYLASYNWDDQIRIWDVNKGQLVAQIPGGGRPNPSDTPTYDSLAWSPDGSQLADAGVDGIVHIWNVSQS